MKRRMKRLAAMLLFGCMVAGSIPAGTVHAEEADAQITEGQTEENSDDVQDSTAPDTASDITENMDDSGSIEAEGAENTETATDTSVTEDEKEEAQDVAQEETDVQTEDANEEREQVQQEGLIEKNANEINYVIVETPYLETPGTERIGVSYGDGSETVSDITLTVRNDEGQDSVWDLSVSADQLYLFSNEFTDESESGTYEVISLNVTDDEGEKNILFSDFQMEAYFGVNEEYSGIEELQPLDTETAKSRSADEAAGVEATVAEIDPENVEESAEQIVDALENAEEQTAGVSTYSADVSSFAAAVGAQAKTAAETKSKNGNVVVALDPGHDSTHAGASYNGLKEEVLTLKIAQYCKAELEKYSGVTVYMTRTGASCPHPGGSSGSDIGDRVYAAADAGADIYVSIHLNSSVSSSANGAEVIIPNKNWKPELAEEGEELAEAILKELKNIGLNMRPDEIYSKDTTINERYPDNSLSDYFSVQIYAKERGIAGIIVEHAFLTNSGDRKYLSSESGLKKLGVADATGIAKYLGLSKDGWTEPKLNATSATSEGIKISWGSVKSAEGYAVYRKTSTSGWQMIGTTKTTSFVDDDTLTNGKTYYYTVRAYKGGESTALANKYSSEYWTGYNSAGVKAVYLTVPQISSTSTAEEGIKLSWQKVSGVSGYAVYRKTDGSGWKMIGTTTSNSYTDDDGLKNKETYYYTLRAYIGNVNTAEDNKYDAQYWSGYNNEGTIGKYYEMPVLTEATASAGGRVISWKKVDGASGYAVYRKVSGGGWATIATTTSLSYVDSENLSDGKTYYYTVRAYLGNLATAQNHKYNSNYWSHYDATGLQVFGAETPELKGTTTAQSGIKIEWTQVNGASGYAVYRKTASTGWGMIATTSSINYTDKNGLENGVEYYYTVRAYKGNLSTAKNNKYDAQYWSGYDDSGVKGRYMSTPALTGEKASASGTTITWKAVSGASGYAVYRKTSGGDWKMIDTTTAVSYTDKSELTNGNTYYYTVRAYAGNADTAIENKYSSTYWSYYDTLGEKTVFISTPALDTAVKLDSGVRVTWKAVSGADGYAIYRKVPGGDWSMYDTTTSTSYTDQSDDTKVYYYTVRAYCGDVNEAKNNKYSSVYWSGYESDGVKISDLETPQLESARVVNNGIEIKWKKVQEASGYTVYRKTAITGWSMIATTNSTSYIDTAAGSSGITYFYTVRAFKGSQTNALSNKYDSEYWSYYDTNGLSCSAYEIIGESDVTVKQMVDFYNEYAPISYPAEELKKGGAESIEDLAQIFYEEALSEGIKPEVVWCQTMLETNYLKFNGTVDIKQFNFAGLGATDDGAKGASFKDVREGVRAQVQHMKAYAYKSASVDNLENELVDPRFHLVTKGAAKYVEILGAKENPMGTGWATSVGYGKNIVQLIQKLQQI